MPVDSKHPLWLANQPRWERCRTALQGQDAVHAAGEKYLPKLAGQDKAEYDAYKGRAMFYGATARTEEVLHQHRDILRAHYVTRSYWLATCRALGLRTREYDDVLVRAVGNFEDFVARYAVVVHNPAQDRPTTV